MRRKIHEILYQRKMFFFRYSRLSQCTIAAIIVLFNLSLHQLAASSGWDLNSLGSIPAFYRAMLAQSAVMRE